MSLTLVLIGMACSENSFKTSQEAADELTISPALFTDSSQSILLSAHIAKTPETDCPEMRSFKNTDLDASVVFQKCLDSAIGKTLRIDPGFYTLEKTIHIRGPLNILPQGKDIDDRTCSTEKDLSCMTFKASQNVTMAAGRSGLFRVTGSQVVISHLVLDGDRHSRDKSRNKQGCQAGDNSQGLGVTVLANNSIFTKSVLKNGLCGTAFEVHNGSHHLQFVDNQIAFNGRHYQNNLWSDGLTVHNAEDSLFLRNVFTDNTDIQMVFGGCKNCEISNNIFRHSNDREGASFGELMIHAWPGQEGDYTFSSIEGNDIDCGAGRLCGYGLLVGGDSWYMGTKAKFGNILKNKIKRAMIGLSVDEITGAFHIKDNQITDILDGEFYCQNNPSRTARTAILNVSPQSKPLLTAESLVDFMTAVQISPKNSVVNRDYDLCIPQPPYIWSRPFEETTAPTPTPTPEPGKSTNLEISITTLYNAFLQRQPDPSGFEHFKVRYQQVGLNQVIREILMSPETLEKSANATDEEFVLRIYKGVLQRNPEPTGLSYWTMRIQSGHPRMSTVESFLISEEYQRLMNKNGLKP